MVPGIAPFLFNRDKPYKSVKLNFPGHRNPVRRGDKIPRATDEAAAAPCLPPRWDWSDISSTISLVDSAYANVGYSHLTTN